MADYYFATICFPVRALQIEAIREWTEDLTWEDEGDGVICYSDYRALYGQFEELEALLVAHGIPFDRRSDGYAEYDPMVRYFRPARGSQPPLDITYVCGRGAYRPIIHVDSVKKALKEKTAEEYLAELEREYPNVEPLEKWCDVR